MTAPAVDLQPHGDREVRLLIECARALVEPDRAERIRQLAGAGLNWDRLLTLAHRNGLAPLLCRHLNKICATSVPADKLGSLRDYFQKNSAFGLLLTGELIRLLKVLNDNGISAVPYKGPALAVKLYGHGALRQFCDLDILVRESDVWAASGVIEAQGFVPDIPIPEKKREAFVRRDYVRLFHRDAGRTLVELHWGIAPRYFAVQFEAEAVWPRLEPMALQGATVFMPCPEDLLIMLSVHGARHSWDKLEGVCSLAELLRRAQNMDWARVWQRSREMHCRRMVLFGLLLAHGLFDVPLPPQAAIGRSPRLLALARDVVRHFSADVVQPRTLSRVALHLRLKDSYTDRIRHCAGQALTATPVDWATMPPLGPLAFAYPLWRAVRLTRKYGLNHERG